MHLQIFCRSARHRAQDADDLSQRTHQAQGFRQIGVIREYDSTVVLIVPGIVQHVHREINA
ncbi:hypothetical protein [Luteibacter sp. 22Crub2.1]|uniref:hypothetical protein n=1 Tax=Luteibacter sp. 22Crub2.1 TaxID=1283288 RepID=UPI0020CA67C4|nr:hypothetical protein [Luteibacter sp. 22Crub2.1]